MNRNKGCTNVLRKAMNRNGIPDRLFRHHGRWASKNATWMAMLEMILTVVYQSRNL